MFWYGHDMGGWALGLMTFSSVVFWALVVFGIVMLIRFLSRSGQQPSSYPPGGHYPQPGPGSAPPQAGPAGTPEQMLAQRFALGEIDEEEYRQRLNTLRGTTGTQETHAW